jgi:hypothetical protein
MRFFVPSVCAILMGLTSGCATISEREPRFIEDIRPVPPLTKVTNFSIQRKDLVDSLSSPKENSVRLVPVYQSVSSRLSYEYRIFDVKTGSAYALLGLEPSDIIVAADRYLVKKPDQFPAFVQLLAGMNEASIEIRRGGEARLLKYRFVPALPTK